MAKISDYQPQKQNANKHSQRGLGLLQRSIQQDGFIGAMTAAADGEIIAGSARLETSAEVFGIDAEPIIVETDGTRPIIVKRIDIESASDPRAMRLSIADNRIQQLDLVWDAEVLQELSALDEVDLGDWWKEKELKDMLPDPINLENNTDNKGSSIKMAQCPKCGFRFYYE